jgi:hypothetical protein
MKKQAEISKDEYFEAKELTKKFEAQQNSKHVESYTCINCKEKEITPMNPERIDMMRQDKGMWNDGTVALISFGYGSRLDLTEFFVGICDNCMESLEQSALAKEVRSFHSKLYK